MMTTKKTTSTRTNKKTRKATINQIRKDLTIQYHALSTVICDDRISTRKQKPFDDHSNPEKPTGHLDKAFDQLSLAINSLNRELGRKVDS